MLSIPYYIIIHTYTLIICHIHNRRRVDDLSFFDYLSSFCFLSIEFHCTFSISFKILPTLFIIIVFWLGCDRPSGHLLFVPALLLSILTPLFLPSSSVSLSYFAHAMPMPECLGKHSCMSSPCPIAILNGTFLFSRGGIVNLSMVWAEAPNLRLSKSN